MVKLFPSHFEGSRAACAGWLRCAATGVGFGMRQRALPRRLLCRREVDARPGMAAQQRLWRGLLAHPMLLHLGETLQATSVPPSRPRQDPSLGSTVELVSCISADKPPSPATGSQKLSAVTLAMRAQQDQGIHPTNRVMGALL